MLFSYKTSICHSFLLFSYKTQFTIPLQRCHFLSALNLCFPFLRHNYKNIITESKKKTSNNWSLIFSLCFLQDGYWADRACEQPLGYICKMKSQTQAPETVHVETGCRKVSTKFQISKYNMWYLGSIVCESASLWKYHRYSQMFQLCKCSTVYCYCLVLLFFLKSSSGVVYS